MARIKWRFLGWVCARRDLIRLFILTVLFGCGRSEPQPTVRSEPTVPPVEHSASHNQMLATLSAIAKKEQQADLSAIREAKEAVPQAEPLQVFRVHRSSGELLLVHGENQLAIDHFQEAIDLLPKLSGRITKSDFLESHLDLAVAYLRQAETENCLACCNGDSCLFPVDSEGVHRQRQGAEGAIGVLTKLLNRVPGNPKARWLLNLAYMTLGEYPDGVPVHLRLRLRDIDMPEEAPEFPKFNNVAGRLGLDAFNLSGGVICDDFDNDNDVDILTSSWESDGQILYYRNNADGTFTDATEDAGLSGVFGGLNLLQADYDNDGDLDVLVLRGAWLGKEEGCQPNSLLKNDGRGRFDDVAFAVGLAGEDFPTQTAAWADYDRDGWLDLYVGNELFPNQLFRNDGKGKFEDVSNAAGVNGRGFTKGVSWGDFDHDGDPDLYVSNLTSANLLYRNEGDGSFRNVAAVAGVELPLQSFPTWFWDYDNDGVLDIWVGSAWWDLGYFVAGYVGIPHDGELNRLYRGNGTGGFQEVGAKVELTEMTMPMGSNFGDLDNDGYLDFYLGTGFPEFDGLMPNAMYWNRNGRKFENVTTAGRFGHLQKGHGVSFADIDNDGDQDIFSQMGGAFPADGFYNALYENPGFGNSFANVRLVGVKSNRFAIGARLCFEFVSSGKERVVYRYINSGGSFGGNPMTQQVGLEQASVISKLTIEWPYADSISVFRDLPVNQLLILTEGKAEFESVELMAFPFQGESSRAEVSEKAG